MRTVFSTTLAGTAIAALLLMVSPAVAQDLPLRPVAPSAVRAESTTIIQQKIAAPVAAGQTTTSVTTTGSATGATSQTSVTTTGTPAGVTSQTTTSVTTIGPAPALKPEVLIEPDQPIKTTINQDNPKRHRHDARTCMRMARYHWLDKAVEADPSLVESICRHYTAALILAHHPRLGAIAQHDHYTCRRLCKWKTVARALAKNGECEKVIALDPEGIYRAVKLDRRLARILAKNPMFDQMISDNPDLGRLLSLYI